MQRKFKQENYQICHLSFARSSTKLVNPRLALINRYKLFINQVDFLVEKYLIEHSNREENNWHLIEAAVNNLRYILIERLESLLNEQLSYFNRDAAYHPKKYCYLLKLKSHRCGRRNSWQFDLKLFVCDLKLNRKAINYYNMLV
jgi:hypothetical protein